MPQRPDNNDKISLELDADGLNPAYIRLIKTLHNTLIHLLATGSEREYFEHSAEALRLCASLIKQAHFIEKTKSGNIPYSEQVLEFSIAVLQEHMAKAKVITYDC